MSITNTQLAQAMNDLIAHWQDFQDELHKWLGGEVGGGPNSDGRYPITDYLGNTTLVTAPAQLEADIQQLIAAGSGSAAQAAASAASAANSAAAAGTLESLADAARSAAEVARDAAQAAQAAAETARNTAIAKANQAIAEANAAATSATEAADSQAAAEAAQLAAEAARTAAEAAQAAAETAEDNVTADAAAAAASAAAAATSESNAAASASAADADRVAAESAASSASVSASNAASSASAAATSATNAANSASAAASSASSASSSASSASTSANNAANSASEAAASAAAAAAAAASIDPSNFYTKVEADGLFSLLGHTHTAADIVSGTFADARIAQSNVTQHQAALSIGWAQLTGVPDLARLDQQNEFTAAGIPIFLHAANPKIKFRATSAQANEEIWYLEATNNGAGVGLFRLRAVNDVEGSAEDVFSITRSGATGLAMALVSDTITLNGVPTTDYARLSQPNTFTSSTGITISAGAPGYRWDETDQSANERRWAATVNSKTFILRAFADDESSSDNFLTATRGTGVNVASLALAADAITLNGVNVTNYARRDLDNYFTGRNYFGRDGTNGYVSAGGGSLNHAGYFEFFTSDSVRRGYIGWASSSNLLEIRAENGWGWHITGGSLYFTQQPRHYGQGAFLSHSAGYTSGKVYVSTEAPSGGADGDIWLQY